MRKEKNNDTRTVLSLPLQENIIKIAIFVSTVLEEIFFEKLVRNKYTKIKNLKKEKAN